MKDIGGRAMQVELEALKRRLYVENRVRNIKFFPGSNADASPEDMARELNKFFASDPSSEDEELKSADCP